MEDACLRHFFFLARSVYPGFVFFGGKEDPCEFLALPRLKFTRGGVWRNWGFPTLGYMPLVLIQTTLSTILPRHARFPALGPDCCGLTFPPLMNIHTARLWRELSANQSEVVASPAHTHARGIPSLPPSCQNSSVPVRLLACTHVLRVLGRLAEFAFPLELKFTLSSCPMTPV